MDITKPEVVRSTPPTRATGETFIEQTWKQSKNIVGLAIAQDILFLRKA